MVSLFHCHWVSLFYCQTERVSLFGSKGFHFCITYSFIDVSVFQCWVYPRVHFGYDRSLLLDVREFHWWISGFIAGYQTVESFIVGILEGVSKGDQRFHC